MRAIILSENHVPYNYLSAAL